MALYLTEKECIEIYVDGLRQARSKSLEIIKAEVSKQPGIFVDFISSLKRSAGASHALAHAQIDHSTKWLTLRDNLERIIELGQSLPSFAKDQNGAWFQISQVLEQLIIHGNTLFNMKSISRSQILADLDVRQLNANKLVSDPTAV